MKLSIGILGAFLALVAAAALTGFGSQARTALAEEPTLPGMCNGRSDANVVLTAHANGKPSVVPKYILNLTTDGSGHPTGTLVLSKGVTRLEVTEWCRLWQHRPGAPPGGSGQCEGGEGDDPNAEGTITAHAVGIGMTGGKQVLVRTDVRSSAEGMFFRVRYREMGAHHEEAMAAEEDGCEDGGWVRVPAEEWFPLDQLRVKTAVAGG